MVDRQLGRSHSMVSWSAADASFGRHPPLISDHRPPPLSNNVYKNCTAGFTSAIDPSGLAALALLSGRCGKAAKNLPAAPLYSPEQRRRRDQSPWTIVQGVLAPVQFLIFLVSLGLVLRYL